MQKSNLPLLIGAAVCLVGVGVFIAWPTFAQNQKKGKEKSETTEKTEKKEQAKSKTDANGIPEKPQEILGFIRKQARGLQFDPTIDEKGFKKKLLLMLKAAEKVLGQKADEEYRVEAIQVKIGVLGALKTTGDKAAPDALNKFLNKLKNDKNKEIQELAVTELLMSRARTDVTKDNKTREALVKETLAFVKGGELQQRLRAVASVATLFEESGHRETAARLYTEMAKLMRASKKEELVEQAKIFDGFARRMVLVGNSMKLKGKTLQGKTLDINDLKGKVILVDFWATWCGPCKAAMPELLRLHKEYNEKGFEVVGVSLDSRREPLEAYIKANKIPWATLWAEGEDGNHPAAEYYGVMSIPTTMLINRKGKVVAMSVHGARLERMIKGLLDDGKTAEKEKEGKKEAPKSPKSK